MEPKFEQPKQYTPEEIAEMEKSRTISDAELLKGGAEYAVDEKGEMENLLATERQKKEEHTRKHNEEMAAYDKKAYEERIAGEKSVWHGSSMLASPEITAQRRRIKRLFYEKFKLEEYDKGDLSHRAEIILKNGSTVVGNGPYFVRDVVGSQSVMFLGNGEQQIPIEKIADVNVLK